MQNTNRHTNDDALLRMILDHLSSAVAVLDNDLRTLYLNPSAEGLLAVSKQHAQGQPFSELLRDVEELTQAFRNALQTGVPFTQRQTQITLATLHQPVLVDISVTPMPDNCLLLEMQAMDRLMRISREEALVTSQQTSRHLARGLAHEIKNPLGGIRGAAQLLARALPDASLQEYTRIIIEESDRLRDLVDRMLGPHELPVMSPVNILEVLERVLSLIRAEYGNAVAFRRDYDPSVPDIQGDRSQLLQALLNIIRNAMQALQEHHTPDATITLRTRVQRRCTIGKRLYKLVCRVDVIDNGPGIPVEMLDNVFYPMISGRADGTGLGLAIAQSVVAKHHGLIECDSTPGNTRFTLYLPLDA
ncbi:MAG TPA: nitrogen regulation protein NR(II) [Pseudomonadales bacterium]|nr:nitrogen regulation protein NR(II) [Pseudomonadales bacterium]